MISLNATEDALVRLVGDNLHATLFVHPRTYTEFKKVFMSAWNESIPRVNPATGRTGIPFYGHFIERRRWMIEGRVMFHLDGFNLGDAQVDVK